MLSERVVDRVCTFLGHPPKCPHGAPIPRGSCCSKFERKVDPLIMRLCDLPLAGVGKIVFIAPKSATRLNRLATLGILPGSDVRLVQRQPSIVVDCGETSVALEEEIATEIYVRPEGNGRR
jgi:DtxR family Mn-dependent transcriptional regulator